MPNPYPARILALLLLFAALVLPGCHLTRGSGGRLTVRSFRNDNTLAPTARIAIYAARPDRTADFILSDIPLDTVLDPDSPLDAAVGNVIHIHMFLYPKAGKTPIDDTAVNATLRHVVLAGGASGVYGGGGFVYPSSSIGSKTVHAGVRQATVRLISASPQFDDLLGASKVTGGFTAARDDDATDAVMARLEHLLLSLPDPAEPPAMKDPAAAPNIP